MFKLFVLKSFKVSSLLVSLKDYIFSSKQLNKLVNWAVDILYILRKLSTIESNPGPTTSFSD